MSIKTTVLTLALLSTSAMVAAAPYSANIRSNYLQACTQGMQQGDPNLTTAINQAWCNCTLDKLEQNMTEQEFIQADVKLASDPNDPSVKKLYRIVEAEWMKCAKVFQ
ncbi:MAG: hypothetical protein Q4G42_08340 [Neisseria sp.]|nr:hypothetical protein [Neisseria sp.]